MTMPRLVTLRCDLSPGDVVVLTGALRELHEQFPGRFITSVRTTGEALWSAHPDVLPAGDDAEDVWVHYDSRSGEERYAAIGKSNQRPIHFAAAWCEGLSVALELEQPLRPRDVRGCVPLSDAERTWVSQVQELTGRPTRYWIVNAGRKSDYTTKLWPTEHFQQVVDATRGRIQWVQVGAADEGHFHPPLAGVIDLRGQTDLRQLVRLVHHADGVLTGVSLLMHLAAAVDRPPHAQGFARPAIVLAGGREPQAWNTYPGQQYLHAIGTLDCCRDGGCWRSRVVPLGDGDSKDQSLCSHVDDGAPRCLRRITPDRVVALLEDYL